MSEIDNVERGPIKIELTLELNRLFSVLKRDPLKFELTLNLIELLQKGPIKVELTLLFHKGTY